MRSITLRDFTIQEDSPETAPASGRRIRERDDCRRDHKSQSEHDWAYAKRALARGDDPALVIQRIADFARTTKTIRFTMHGIPSRKPKRNSTKTMTTYNTKLQRKSI